MDCYIHTNAAAVGICKSCAKGVCRICAIEVTNGIACSESCKNMAESLSQLQLVQLRNKNLASAQRFIQPIVAAVTFGFGLFLLAFSIGDFAGWFLIAMGGSMLLALLFSRFKK